MKSFQWIPGTGPDPEALQRLTDFFPMPPEPMGEPWFMYDDEDDRLIFDELITNPYDSPIDPFTIYSFDSWRFVFREITSGTTCFGHECDPMWRPWFFYLLGRLIPNAHENQGGICDFYLWECLVSAFMAQYPDDIAPEPYPGFRDDIFNTLGLAPMSSHLWSDEEKLRDWKWFTHCGGVSSAIFFCLKYLPIHAIAPWVRSVLSITAPFWVAQMICWLVGYHRYRTGDFVFSKWLPEKWLRDSSRVSAAKISWELEEHLGLEIVDSVEPPRMTLITEDRALLFEKCLGKAITQELWAQWQEIINQCIPEQNTSEQAELEALIGEFSKRYLPAA